LTVELRNVRAAGCGAVIVINRVDELLATDSNCERRRSLSSRPS
jgi:hypothetical protein